MKSLPKWAKEAIKKMKEFEVGDIIWFDDYKYHVRGMVDGWLVVRIWSFDYWNYRCISPAEYDVYSKSDRMRIKKKK